MTMWCQKNEGECAALEWKNERMREWNALRWNEKMGCKSSKVRHFWNCFVTPTFRVQLLQGVVNQEENERMVSHTYATMNWIASCYSACYMFWQLKSYFGFRFRYRKGITFSSSRKKTPEKVSKREFWELWIVWTCKLVWGITNRGSTVINIIYIYLLL